MKTYFVSAQVEQLRRDAKRLARATTVPLSQALDQIAESKGFRNWSLLVKHSSTVKPDSTIQKASVVPVSRTRYYLHGDQVETDPTKYFCAQCDLFVESAHFMRNHGGDTYDRALHSIERWSRNGLENKFRRPTNAVNLLEAEARRRHAEKDAARSPFHRWLQNQRGRLDPVGDLAQDVFADRDFPVATAELAALQGYLHGQGAVQEAVEALTQAWSEFSQAVEV